MLMAHKAMATGFVSPVAVGSRDRLAIINNEQATCIQDHLFKEAQAWFRPESKFDIQDCPHSCNGKHHFVLSAIL